MTTAQSTKGKRGFGTGAGRKKGVPNKRTQVAQAILEKANLDPLEEAIKIYRGEISFPEMIGIVKGKAEFVNVPAAPKERIRCLIECLKRAYPELRSIEVGNMGDEEFVLTVRRK